MKIYLVAPSDQLDGNYFGTGLVEGDHPQVLVSFVEYMGRRTFILFATQRKRKAPTEGTKRAGKGRAWSKQGPGITKPKQSALT